MVNRLVQAMQEAPNHLYHQNHLPLWNSIRTRQVNYQNRPRWDQLGGQKEHKRQFSGNSHQPGKYQCVFNTEATVHQEEDPEPVVELEIQEDNTYNEEVYKDDNEEEKDYADNINFLD